jgi:SOS-response transcriptional repressor LexA
MTNFGDRVRQRRDELGMSQEELGKAAGISQSTVAQIERGRNKGTKHILELGKALGVSPQWLQSGRRDALAPATHISANADKPKNEQDTGVIVKSPSRRGGSLEEPNTEPGPDIKGKYPLISWVQAGAWESIVDNFVPGDAEDWLDAPVRVSRSSYYLRVRGESMYDPADHRSFHEGEKVLVDPNADAEHGSFVVVRLDDESEATFKQLIIEGGKKYLKALNPNWPNRIFEVNGNATICGVVKGKFVDGY